MKPNEILPFQLEVTADGVRDFAVRVIQSIDCGGVTEVVGGQTFR